jgi:hypothetical protein
MRPRPGIFLFLFCLLFSSLAHAAETHGQVFYHGLPVPGAIVTLTQNGKTFSAVTDRQGLYRFADIGEGASQIRIELRGFEPVTAPITIAPSAPQGHWDLTMLGLEKILADAKTAAEEATKPAPVAEEAPKPKEKSTERAANEPPPAHDENSDKASDGFLIKGSQNNAATTPFALDAAFGNRRSNSHALYNGSLGVISGNSVFNARPYSLTGLNTPKDDYNQTTLVAAIGGPLRIPHLFAGYHAPNFFVAYQWTRNSTASTLSELVPTDDARKGNLSGTIYNPATGLPFTGLIPISTQAAALLNLYPTANLANSSNYNYQTAVLNGSHSDSLQSRINKSIGHRGDYLYGGFAFNSVRSNSKNLFGFVDTTDLLGVNGNAHWSHRIGNRYYLSLGYNYSRQRTQVTPEFAYRENVSKLASITGNNQDAANWGPPALGFSSGIASLSDANSSFNRNQTQALSGNINTWHRRHEIDLGGEFRRQQYNVNSQSNPRGSFSFTGAATAGSGSGSDFADFLLGIPDTSSIAYGNADKYFRQSVMSLFVKDDWRIRPDLTINLGLRWDYEAPVTERKNRLVNLDIGSGFTAATAVLASSPTGSLSGAHYSNSLVEPDRRGIEPRFGFAWRPIPASTLVIRGGYGIYYDTSVYLGVAQNMSQQAPLSTSLSIANSTRCPLTLASGFPTSCATATGDTFAVDPHLRVGYAQNWQLVVQRDLPFSLVLTGSYLGTKGTHGMQEVLPNSYPLGATNPCSSCTSGYVYRSSGGNSSRNAGQLQLRRRLRAGLTASFNYTWSKSIDDAAQLGSSGSSSTSSSLTAQNWRDPRAERSLSSFDQRHLINASVEYTTGMGMGRTLMSGWSGRILKEWAANIQIKDGSGLPETPRYSATVPGTAMSGSLRPNLTGASLYTTSGSAHLNSAAYSAPTTGTWGTAGRNSITGPAQFSLDGSLARTFRLRHNYSLDVRADASNLLNHAVYSAWNTTTNSSTFGLPSSADAMRSIKITGRFRF